MSVSWELTSPHIINFSQEVQLQLGRVWLGVERGCWQFREAGKFLLIQSFQLALPLLAPVFLPTNTLTMYLCAEYFELLL